ncbi:hypothetical protein ACFS4T_03245 [Pseudomonas lini]
MSLPSLVELPGVLLPFVTRAEQSFRTAVGLFFPTIMACLPGRLSAGRNLPVSLLPATL